MDEGARRQLHVIDAVTTALDAAGIPAWLFGGWGLDARIGHLTREHGDVEFWVERGHAERSRAVLVSAGATALSTQPPAESCEFTWDGADFSTAYVERRADGGCSHPSGRWSDWQFPPDSFPDETVTFEGSRVRVMSIAGMLAMKEQYPYLRRGGPWRPKDVADLATLEDLLAGAGTASAPGTRALSSRLVGLSVDALDPARLADFWARVLGRDAVDDRRGVSLPRSDTQVGLRFTPGGAERSGPDRVHLHLTSTSPADQQHTVAAALALGAEHLDVGQLPDEGHVVLADPEGNAFCVIEPGNSFLAGCGFLGELACEGTREVGLFWAEALGWPLVWDQDGETAVQSPHGGTKVAWGGPPVVPEHGRNRQRFELTVVHGTLDAEVDRLTALGAVWLGSTEDGAVELADPDGHRFRLTPPTS